MEPSQNPPDPGRRPLRKPRPWRYLLACALLALAWIAVLELWLKPAFLAVPGAAASRRLGLYLLPPFAAVLAVYLLRAAYVRRRLGQQEEQAIRAQAEEHARRREEEARQAAVLEGKRFMLEILGIGVALEYLRHDQVWDELQGGRGQAPVLSTDPGDYPSRLEDKERAHREREAEALERVLGWLSEDWPVPAFLAGPALGDPQMGALLESNLLEALGYGEVQGRRLRVVETMHEETPDALLVKAFDFLERHSEVPVVLLVAEDGAALRHALRAEDAPDLLTEGPRCGDAPTECVVALLLGKRERIEPMRALVRGEAQGQDALKPYWEKEWLTRSAGAFRTSEWLPRPWPEPLLAAFSRLPVIGRMHRPQQTVFQAKGETSRAGSLKEAWVRALEGLEDGRGHRHLFYDCGPVAQGRRLAPLSRTMVALASDFEVFDQGINLHRRLGDVGAAGPLLGLALAGLASQREEGVSASVCLRREDGASVFMTSPPAAPVEPHDIDHVLAEA